MPHVVHSNQFDLEAHSLSDAIEKDLVRKTPRPHQLEAVKDTVKALSVSGSDVRAQLISACGTGKTLTTRWASEELGNRTLLVEPSLNLVRQNLRAWQQHAIHDGYRYLVVCSDESTVKIGEDEPIIKPEELTAAVTNNPKVIRQFLSDKSPLVLVSTHHSAHLIEQAMRQKEVPRFDCTVIDEAHQTATHEDAMFALIHDSNAIRSRTRLYTTATPKVFMGDAEGFYSMDDEKTFGKVCHRLSFSKAIEKGLLSDYQFVIATIPESESKRFRHEDMSQAERRYAVAEIAFLRAVEQYDLSKVITFHSRIARAEAVAEGIHDAAKQMGFKRDIWFHTISGKMPTSTRTSLLDILGDNPRKVLSGISNARCVREGVDVPDLDGIALFDPMQSQIDIIQAVGRAIRLSQNKTKGTIIVPVVVPSNTDEVAFLESSAFRPVLQVIRALRAHDDRFDLRCRAILRDPDGKKGPEGPVLPPVEFSYEELPDKLKKAISTKVFSIGAGLLKGLLTEEAIIEAAREFYRIYKRLPTMHSTEEVPGMPGENWRTINGAGYDGCRGLTQGRTLSKILGPLKKELGLDNLLTEEAIIEAARKFYFKYKRLPTVATKKEVPGMPGETWVAIHSAGQQGLRGLAKGRTLFMILEPLKKELGLDNLLTEETIIEAARKFYIKYNRLPTAKTKEEVPGMPGETWSAINAAGLQGGRGLVKGQSLSKILKPLKKELGLDNLLTEETIIEAARKFYFKYQKLPTQITKEEVPGMPNTTWYAINSAGQHGYRGLTKGRTLSMILAPLQKELGLDNLLTEEAIIEAARKFYIKYNRLPTAETKEEVPGMPGETWNAISGAGYRGIRGLNKGRSLSKILAPLRKELDLDLLLTEKSIIEAARKFYIQYKKLPTQDTKEEVPGMPGETWGAIHSAARQGFRGLTKGRTLYKILAPLRQELGLE